VRAPLEMLQPDPVSLLKVITAYPEVPTITDLVLVYGRWRLHKSVGTLLGYFVANTCGARKRGKILLSSTLASTHTLLTGIALRSQYSTRLRHIEIHELEGYRKTSTQSTIAYFSHSKRNPLKNFLQLEE
jgi:hypothetical protein